jgi:hypothetical protein
MTGPLFKFSDTWQLAINTNQIIVCSVDETAQWTVPRTGDLPVAELVFGDCQRKAEFTRALSRSDLVAQPLARLVEGILYFIVALLESGPDLIPGGLGGVLDAVQFLV